MLGTVLMYGSIFSPLPCLLIGWRYWPTASISIRTILLIITLSFSSDIIMVTLLHFKIKNLPVANVYGLLEGLLFLFFFYQKLPDYRSAIRIASILFLLLYLADIIFITELVVFNAYSRTLEAAMLIILSVLFFLTLFQKETDIFIDNNAEFWIVVGVLVYFSGAFFSFLLSTDILSVSPDRFYSSWILHNVSNLIKNIIFAISLWKARPN
jgi:hypothetical protein